MELTKLTYVPSIRWKEGEYGALSGLALASKNALFCSSLSLPSSTNSKKKPDGTVQDHIQPFVKRFESEWNGAAWIAVHDTTHSVGASIGSLLACRWSPSLGGDIPNEAPAYRKEVKIRLAMLGNSDHCWTVAFHNLRKVLDPDVRSGARLGRWCSGLRWPTHALFAHRASKAKRGDSAKCHSVLTKRNPRLIERRPGA